jgi:sec-independent protein translocase protein TatA
MIGDLFDSPWKVLIVAVVLIVLFGSKKLPHAARSLGQSMRILKKEVSDLHHDEPGTDAQATPRPTATVAAPAPAVRAGASSERQRTRQPG